MRKVLISLAAAAATLAVAAPASAQVYGAPRYNAPYGNAYGYGYGNIRALQMRVDAIQRQINVLDRLAHRLVRDECGKQTKNGDEAEDERRRDGDHHYHFRRRHCRRLPWFWKLRRRFDAPWMSGTEKNLLQTPLSGQIGANMGLLKPVVCTLSC
jgi:hypothetical protein